MKGVEAEKFTVVYQKLSSPFICNDNTSADKIKNCITLEKSNFLVKFNDLKKKV